MHPNRLLSSCNVTRRAEEMDESACADGSDDTGALGRTRPECLPILNGSRSERRLKTAVTRHSARHAGIGSMVTPRGKRTVFSA